MFENVANVVEKNPMLVSVVESMGTVMPYVAVGVSLLVLVCVMRENWSVKEADPSN